MPQILQESCRIAVVEYASVQILKREKSVSCRNLHIELFCKLHCLNISPLSLFSKVAEGENHGNLTGFTIYRYIIDLLYIFRNNSQVFPNSKFQNNIDWFIGYFHIRYEKNCRRRNDRVQTNNQDITLIISFNWGTVYLIQQR